MRIRSARPNLKLTLMAIFLRTRRRVGKCGVYSRIDLQPTNAETFERMRVQQIGHLFDRVNDVVAGKSWIKEGIKWQVGDAWDVEILGALCPQIVANNLAEGMSAWSGRKSICSFPASTWTSEQGLPPI